MTSFKGLFATAAAAALLTTTTAAAAATVVNPAASLSVAANGRAASPAAHGSRIGADVPTTTLISIGVLAALVVIVLVATNNDDDADSD